MNCTLRAGFMLLCLPLVLAAGIVYAAEPLKGGIERLAPLSGGEEMTGKEDNRSKHLQGGAEDRSSKRLEGGSEFNRPFTGQMEFSTKVAPVEPMFRPHKLFAESNLPSEGTEEGWYQIPAWRAGKFHRETQTDHTLFGDVEIVSKVDHVYGMQRDRNGGIWHHEIWPRVTKVALEGYTEYKIVHRYEPIKITRDEFCIRANSTDIDVDDKTGKIIRVTKQEEFDRYVPAGDGVSKCLSRWQGFSMNGGPNTQLERTTLEEVRVDPFRTINTWHGKDLRASFTKFLKANDLADLIPPPKVQASAKAVPASDSDDGASASPVPASASPVPASASPVTDSGWPGSDSGWPETESTTQTKPIKPTQAKKPSQTTKPTHAAKPIQAKKSATKK